MFGVSVSSRNAHGAFTPEMMKLPQATWIETFLEGVTVDRQKHWTVHIQGACLVHVQGLWCHVLSVCM